jgi:hypothetical protein
VTPEGEVVDLPEEAPVQPAIAAQKPANDEDSNRQAAE